MSKGNKTLLVIAALVVLVVGGYKWRYPTYSWHQKLTVEIETPEGVVTGSSVVGVSVQYQMTFGFKDAASVRNRWEGEAAIVELPGKRYLFVLLGHPVSMVQNAYKSVILGSSDARFTDMKAYYSRLARLRQTVSVPPKRYPMLVTFTDINDPKTVKRVDPNDLAASFGAGYSLKSITRQITDEPVTKGLVEGVINWLSQYPEPRLGPATGSTTNIPFYRDVSHGDFIRR